MPRISKDHPEYQYLNLLEEIYKHGVKNVDRGTGDTSYSLFGRQARFDLSKGFPLLTTKKVFWRGIVEELYWFISGQNNIKYLVDRNVHIWDDYPYKIYREKVDVGKEPDISKEEFIAKIAKSATYAKKHGVLPKIYGELWRHWPTRKGKTIDQLKWMIEELKTDPYARNAIVSSWNPEYLYTMASQEDAARFPLCHVLFQTSIKDGKLNLHLYQRTCDMFLGVPFNIACYALMVIIIAKITGYKPGEFIHSYGDVHIYENHMEQVKEELKRVPRPLPTVRIKGKLKNIDDFRPENVVLENYNPHPALKAELSVSGGFFIKYAKKNVKKRPKISLISAVAEKNRGIGKDNKLLWNIPADLAHFKKITSGHPVIMGQKTFESIGHPLADRTNIIVTKDPNLKVKGCLVSHSIDDAIQKASRKDQKEIFFIGGGSIYAQTIGLADKLYLTLVQGDYEADSFFPDYSKFGKIISSKKEKSNGYKYQFVELERK